jgi:hypothetical protein
MADRRALMPARAIGLGLFNRMLGTGGTSWKLRISRWPSRPPRGQASAANQEISSIFAAGRDQRARRVRGEAVSAGSAGSAGSVHSLVHARCVDHDAIRLAAHRVVVTCNTIRSAGTTNAFVRGMSIRTFRARNGSTWLVRRIESSATVMIPGAQREWLAFEDEAGTERRRLFNIPPNWEDMSDERLDLLRRYAEPSRYQPRATPARGMRIATESDGS